MSVNIFGAATGGNKISEHDQKFKTLSINLASKVNKSGDIMEGDLLLNSAELRKFGVSDITNGQSTSLLLGDVDNQIRYNYGHPIKLASSHGIKFTCLAGEVCQLGKNSSANLFMNNNNITALRDPDRPQDAATKKYVDNKKSYSGYIPVLEANFSCLGFTASSSTVSTTKHQPFGAFNLNSDMDNGSWVSALNNTTGWLQIKCPERIKIWRIALKARKIDGRDITSWNLTASNDATSFTTLINSTTVLTGSATAPTFIEVTASESYQYYRLNITSSIGSPDVGVQLLQLYIMN